MNTLISFLFAAFAITNGDVVDVLQTCDLGENPCQINQYNRVLQELALYGDYSLDELPLDPLDIEDIHVITSDNFINFNLITGVVKGIKSCVITDLDIDTDNLFAKLVVKCNKIDVSCRYKAKVSGGLGLLFNEQVVHGDGNAKISLDGLVLTLYKPFYVDKVDNDYFIKSENTNGTYGYDYQVKNKATFDIKNVYAGTQDISSLVNLTLNTNWRFYIAKYGRDFLNEAVKIIFTLSHTTVFANIPAQTYVTDIADYY